MCTGKRHGVVKTGHHADTSSSSSTGNETSERVVTWNEVRKHNRHDDNWCVIHGKVYNVTEWSKIHPGGDIVLLSGGRDASILFESYHVNGVPRGILDKYRIGRIESSVEKMSDGTDESFYLDLEKDAFYNVLKKRVASYFRENNVSRRDHWHMYVKSFLILSLYGSSLVFMNMYRSYVAALFAGIGSSLIGTCIMHDANHGAFSKHRWINTLMGMGMDLIGSSRYVWELHHVTGHHQYTNLSTRADKVDNDNAPAEENDPDLFSSYPFIRMTKDLPWEPKHRYQHIYALPIFTLFTMAKVFRGDYQVIMANTFGGKHKPWMISMNSRLSSPIHHTAFWAWKMASLCYLEAIPIYLHGFAHGVGLVIVQHMACGLLLALMFAVTHISDNCIFLKHNQDYKLSDVQTRAVADARRKWGITSGMEKQFDHRSWGALQAVTSTNWSLDSFFWTHFSGGLNHQVEHHLFPGITHTRYPEIRPIVEKTCAEYGVPYVAAPSLTTALGALLGHLKKMGES